MNANPATCACERCEIDRESAPYQRAWLTAFREATTAQVSAALDAVENGSHRDSPEANGAPAGVDRPDAGAGKGTP